MKEQCKPKYVVINITDCEYVDETNSYEEAVKIIKEFPEGAHINEDFNGYKLGVYKLSEVFTINVEDAIKLTSKKVK